MAGDWWGANEPGIVAGQMDASGGISPETVKQFYRQYLGREASDAEAAQWANGGMDLATIQGAIQNSDEAKQRTAAKPNATPGQPSAGAGGDEAWLDQKMAQYQIDPQERPYWSDFIKSHGGVQNVGESWLDDRLMRADSSIGVRSGQVQRVDHGGGGGGNWYGGAGGFGSPPPEYQVPDLPPWLQGEFSLSPYAMPTAAEFEASPGFQVGLDSARQGAERAAAAKGSVLSGGFQKALGKYLSDYGTTKYGDFVSMGLGVNNANNAAKLSSRQQNAGEYQQGVGNQYAAFTTNVGNKRNAENDYWSRLRDQATLGQSSSLGARPS